MSSVDQAKSFRQVALDRVLRQRFVYHHIPKCGGTSVGRALRKRYILSQVTVAPEPSFRAFELFHGSYDRDKMLIDVLDLREQMLLYHMFDDVRGISLHVRFSEKAYQAFKDRYKFITMLRDPVQRFVSHYYWSFNKPNAHARIEEKFEAFLDTPRAKRLGSTLVEYLCGLPKEVPTDAPEAIEAAIANLSKFAVVGDIGDTQKFEHDVKDSLGVRVSVGHENKRRAIAQREKPTDKPELRERIEELCGPDLQVWKHFKRNAK